MSVQVNDLNDEEKYFLLKYSYLNLTLENFSPRSPMSLLDTLERAKGRAESVDKLEYSELITEYQALVKQNPSLANIRVIGYENHNPQGTVTDDDKTGFVGYALQDEHGNRGFLFRGSESDTLVDWTDNAESTLMGTSTQVEQAKQFFETYSKDAVEGASFSLYGHSKGNNLVSEVFVDHLDKEVYAYGVNGQPIFWYDLTEEQKAALRGERYTFIVHEGDFVSSLGQVDYMDTIVKLKDMSTDFFYPHSLDSVLFDATGHFEAARKPNFGDKLLETNLVTDTLFGIPFLLRSVAIKRYAYVIIDAVKLTVQYVWNSAAEAARKVADLCVELMAKLDHWTKDKLKHLATFFDDLIAKGSHLLHVIGKLFGGGGTLVEPIISVETSRLGVHVNRLTSIRRQVASINDRIEALYWRMSILDMGHLLKADYLTNSTWKIGQCVDYLNTSATRLNDTEQRIVRTINSI